MYTYVCSLSKPVMWKGNCEALTMYLLWILTGFMTKCLSQGGSSLWVVVQMVVGTITTRTRLFVVVTESSRWTFMSLAAHPQLRPYSMDYSSCRKRSIGARISSIGGPNKPFYIAAGNIVCKLLVLINVTVLALCVGLAISFCYYRSSILWYRPKPWISWDMLASSYFDRHTTFLC